MPSLLSIHKLKEWKRDLAAKFGISTKCFNGKSGSTADLKESFKTVLKDLVAEHGPGGEVSIQWMSDGFMGFKHISFVNIGMRVTIVGKESNQYANIRIM